MSNSYLCLSLNMPPVRIGCEGCSLLVQTLHVWRTNTQQKSRNVSRALPRTGHGSCMKLDQGLSVPRAETSRALAGDNLHRRQVLKSSLFGRSNVASTIVVDLVSRLSPTGSPIVNCFEQFPLRLPSRRIFLHCEIRAQKDQSELSAPLDPNAKIRFNK